jgi:metallophosphoesterase (TIGR00282 family)
MRSCPLLRVLFIGDIVGEPGRRIVDALLPGLKASLGIHFTIANCENSAAGRGVTPKIARFLIEAGVDVLTSGNHIWDRPEIIPYIDTEPLLLRPGNYPDFLPGRGMGVYLASTGHKIAVINLCGGLFMGSYDNPFTLVPKMVERARFETPIIILDFHAEATSEKQAMGWFLDGQVSAVIGTHTHVQTADERVLPGGTAYITDAGMTGSMDSIIGMEREKAIKRFVTLLPQRLEPGVENVKMNAVLVDIDPGAGKALRIERLIVGEDNT